MTFCTSTLYRIMSTIDLYRLVSVGLQSFILVGQINLDFMQKLNIHQIIVCVTVFSMYIMPCHFFKMCQNINFRGNFLLSFISIGQSKLDFWQKLNVYPRKLLCFVNVHNSMPGLQNVPKFEFQRQFSMTGIMRIFLKFIFT